MSTSSVNKAPRHLAISAHIHKSPGGPIRMKMNLVSKATSVMSPRLVAS